jgi:hypothetical protein
MFLDSSPSGNDVLVSELLLETGMTERSGDDIREEGGIAEEIS